MTPQFARASRARHPRASAPVRTNRTVECQNHASPEHDRKSFAEIVCGPLLCLVFCFLGAASLLGCGTAKSDPAAGAPPPAQVEQEQDLNVIQVDHPEQFPLVTAAARTATSELVVTGVVTAGRFAKRAGRFAGLRPRRGYSRAPGRHGAKRPAAADACAATTFPAAIPIIARPWPTRLWRSTQLERAKDLYAHGAISLNDLQIAQDTEDKAKVDVETTAEHLRLLGNDPDNPNGVVDIVRARFRSDHRPAGHQCRAACRRWARIPSRFPTCPHVWVVCDVYENDLPNVRLGDSADIRLNAYPDQVFKGTISNIGAILDPNLRTAKVRIEVRNPGIMRLGMFVTATFRGQKQETHASFRPRRSCICMTAIGYSCPRRTSKFQRVEVVSGNHAARKHAGSRLGHPAGRASRDRTRSTFENTVDAVGRNDSQARRFRPENRFLVLAAALLLFGWGAISFHQLPVEAYPDVADNYVEIITQWPGISAEQIEQQVTIPLEIVMNGIPHVTHLRSFSLFGLSDLKLIFDDEEENAWNRERVLERLSQVTLPPGVVAADGHGLEPGRPDLFLHAAQHQSAVRRDGVEIDRRLGGREKFQVRPRYRRCCQLRRPHARISGARRSQQADRLRTQPRPGGAAAHQQQHQCRRQLHRSRPAADQYSGSGPGQERAATSKTPSSRPRTARRCA